MSSLYLIGSIQTIFLSLLILTKKKLKLSDFFLTFFILLMGGRLLFIYFDELDLYNTYPQIIVMEFVYWPLFGPLLYLYISAITSHNQKFRWIYLIHFLPALIVFVAFSGYIIESGHLHFRDYQHRGLLFQIGIYTWFYTTHVYFILCIIKLHWYRRRIKNYFSYKKSVDLKWLTMLTYGFGIFLFYSLFFIMTKGYINIEMPDFIDHLTWLIMVVYIFGLGFYGYKQKGVFSNIDASAVDGMDMDKGLKTNLVTKPPVKGKTTTQYAKSRLNESESKAILEKLLKNMKEEKSYMDSELDIRILSETLNTSTHKLSQVINTNLNKNFFEFINEYRVEEAKLLLKNPQYDQEKIMTIAYDCGFSSKSSFFSVFKKFTSQTPTRYKSKHLSN